MQKKKKKNDTILLLYFFFYIFMENNPQNLTTENQNPVGTPAEATKITFVNRYFHLSAPHNRVSRSTFLVNIIILEVLLNFLPSSIFVTL